MKELIKKEGGASVYILGVYFIVFLLIIYLCDMQNANMSRLQKDFDTGMLISLLGSANINVEELGRSGNRVIHESCNGEDGIWGATENAEYPDTYLDNTLAQFQSLFASNLGLSNTWTCNKTIVKSPITLEEFKVFNVYENPETGEMQVYEFTWTSGAWNVNIHGVDEEVYVAGAGDRGKATVEVKDTTVYAHISFDMTVMPYLTSADETDNARIVRAHMARCVSIPENEAN